MVSALPSVAGMAVSSSPLTKPSNFYRTAVSPNRIPRSRLTARASADPAQVEVGWQIIVGSLAGVTPFVVAGIEFSKRIIAQRRCQECGGSGLILEEDDYYKCPGCGGFLPWQSWKRFFSG